VGKEGIVWIDPALMLDGQLVRLVPLQPAHASALFAISQDPCIWQYLMVPQPRSEQEMDLFIARILAERDAGQSVPFAIVQPTTGVALGSTRYLDLAPLHRSLSIGWTWLGRPYWRSGANLESKYLLLSYAFEQAGAIRVQIRVDARNSRSQAAVEALGAVREGVLRQHLVLSDGYRRSSVIYSILEEEWPRVKAGLEARLTAHGWLAAP
jgi:RimJ/RimL family protein N-acetyltransferase